MSAIHDRIMVWFSRCEEPVLLLRIALIKLLIKALRLPQYVDVPKHYYSLIIYQKKNWNNDRNKWCHTKLVRDVICMYIIYMYNVSCGIWIMQNLRWNKNGSNLEKISKLEWENVRLWGCQISSLDPPL